MKQKKNSLGPGVLSCYTNNVDDIIYNLRTTHQVGVILCMCQINLYLTGLYGVRKNYIGFQYGTKFTEQTVSFMYMNEFGGWAKQPAALVGWVLFCCCKDCMLRVHERRAGIYI